MSETVSSPAFSDISAQDTALAAQEAQEWIEAVTGRTFGSSFRKSLEDGVILCELMTKLYPDSIRKINTAKSPIAHLDNIQQFLFACKELGLNDAQLFDKMDLQEAKGIKATGVKRNEADRRIRSVCITLYWLGQTIAGMEGYSGPQLDLDAFRRIMYGIPAVNNVSSNGVASSEQHQPNHYQLSVERGVSPLTADLKQTNKKPAENGHGLTFEQEQTADQLLADIQSAVDDMLLDFQSSPVVSPEPPSPLSPYKANQTQTEHKEPLSKKVGMTIAMNSINGGFGFRIVGGRDFNAKLIPQVDLVAPGLAAYKAGLKEGDELVSVNKQDVSSLNHEALVSMIKQAGAEGSVMLGVIRTVQQKGNNPPKHEREEVDSAPLPEVETHKAWEEQHREQERKAQEIALMYRRGPPPTVGSQPLPPLVEHQEESALEQINELLESTPVPPPHSSSPSPPPSPPTPTISPPHLFSAKQNAEITPELQDDRETIEKELQELSLLEMTKPSEQSEEELSLASSGKQSGPLQAIVEEPPLTVKQETTTKTDEVSLKIDKAPSPSQPPQIDHGTPHQSQAGGGDEHQPSVDPELELEAQLQKLLEFSEMPDNDIMSLPLLESPLPPLPQTEAPKRQKVNSPPDTRPKPTRKAPSPPKQKPSKKTSSKENEESILSLKTRLPNQTTANVSKVQVDGSSQVSEKKEPPKSVLSQEKETAKSADVKPQEQVKSPTDRPLVFTPPSPPSSPPSSEEIKSCTEQTIPLSIASTPVTHATVNMPLSSDAIPISSDATLSKPVTFTEQTKPLEIGSTPTTNAHVIAPVNSDATPSKPTTTTTSKPTTTTASKPTTTTTSKPTTTTTSKPTTTTTSKPVTTTVSTPITPTTPIQSMSTNSAGSYHKEEMRTLTPEDVEIIGDMKISRVQRTKWTPKGSLTEFVTPPKTPTRGPFQDQLQQHYSYPMQAGELSDSIGQHSNNEAQKASRRSEVYQRYSQPENESQYDTLSKSMYQLPHGAQQTTPERPWQHKTQWKSQEELRIKQQPQNDIGQQLQQWPQQHHHQMQRDYHQQYTPNRPTTHPADAYRQSSVPNGHTGTGGYKSTSLPRNRQEDWRVNRSHTWSAVDRISSRDGPQPAYAIKAGNPYELCSRCHQMLGGGPIMAIPGAKTQYHLQCFVCRVCRNPLVGTVPKNTLVIMKNRQPHCHRCVSNNKDTLMTEC